MLAANFSDPENARIIYLAAGGLILMAAGLVAGTIWWWRTSAVEHPVLGPLEVMGTKPFLTADDEMRRDLIESARFEPAADEHELVLGESLDDVFPDGVPTPAVKAPPVPVSLPDSLDVDPFDPFDGAVDPSAELAANRGRVAREDLEALADDIWGPADTGATARPIDPLLKSDDIW